MSTIVRVSIIEGCPALEVPPFVFAYLYVHVCMYLLEWCVGVVGHLHWDDPYTLSFLGHMDGEFISRVTLISKAINENNRTNIFSMSQRYLPT